MERNLYDDLFFLDSKVEPQEKISHFFEKTVFEIKCIISTYANNPYYKDEFGEDIKYQMRENHIPVEICNDIVAMLYIVTNTVMDRLNFMKGDLLERYNLTEEDIKSRLAFYDKIVKNIIRVRGESLLFDIPPSIQKNPVLCCATAFCDIVKNPMLINDYQDAPVVIEGFENNFEFVNGVAMPIIETVAKYASKIIRIISPLLDTVNEFKRTKQNKNDMASHRNGQTHSNEKIILVIFAIVMGLFIISSINYLFG